MDLLTSIAVTKLEPDLSSTISVTRFLAMTIMHLITPEAEAKLELLFSSFVECWT